MKTNTNTQATHTPGPWHRNIRASGKYPTVYAGRNQHVARITEQDNPDEMEANIDLIAAAPDLLAALETISNSEEKTTGDFICDFQTLQSVARAAIAKAKGE